MLGLQGPGLRTWRPGREPRLLRVMGKSCHGDRVRSELEMRGVAGTLRGPCAQQQVAECPVCPRHHPGQGRPPQGRDALTCGRGSSLERLLSLLVLLLLHHLSGKQPQRSENKSVSEPGLQSQASLRPPGLSSEPASSLPGLPLPGLLSPFPQAELWPVQAPTQGSAGSPSRGLTT